MLFLAVFASEIGAIFVDLKQEVMWLNLSFSVNLL